MLIYCIAIATTVVCSTCCIYIYTDKNKRHTQMLFSLTISIFSASLLLALTLSSQKVSFAGVWCVVRLRLLSYRNAMLRYTQPYSFISQTTLHYHAHTHTCNHAGTDWETRSAQYLFINSRYTCPACPHRARRDYETTTLRRHARHSTAHIHTEHFSLRRALRYYIRPLTFSSLEFRV